MKCKTYIWSESFHVGEYSLPHLFILPFIFPYLCPTVHATPCSLMFLVQVSPGSIGQILVSRCCFWWRADIIFTILLLPSFTPAVPYPHFCLLLVTRPNLLLLFASPLSCYCDVLYTGGKYKQGKITPLLYTCRYALGMCVLPWLSCCGSVWKFLQRLYLLSPF